MESLLINTGVVLLLIIIGYLSGSIKEKRHYESIRFRERKLKNIPTINLKTIKHTREIEEVFLVTGSVVIALDYFKVFLAGLYNFFGGEVRSYESLVDRARREATLRMKKEAGNCDLIMNVRIQTSTIGLSTKNQKSAGNVEAIVYGTAIRYKTDEVHS